MVINCENIFFSWTAWGTETGMHDITNCHVFSQSDLSKVAKSFQKSRKSMLWLSGAMTQWLAAFTSKNKSKNSSLPVSSESTSLWFFYGIFLQLLTKQICPFWSLDLYFYKILSLRAFLCIHPHIVSRSPSCLVTWSRTLPTVKILVKWAQLHNLGPFRCVWLPPHLIDRWTDNKLDSMSH